MKFPAILTFIAFSCLGLTAQVTLEQTYNHSGTLTEISEDEYKYFIMDVPLEQCRIYNLDHTLYKSINLPIPEGYFLYDLKFVTRNLFNNDEKIELLYIYHKVELINSQSVYTYGLRVINESGSELLNLSDGAYAEVQMADSIPKLLTWQYIWYDYYYLVYTNVYTLGGSSSKSAIMAESKPIKLFPNPVNEEVVIELAQDNTLSDGSLLISDMQGREVLRQPVLAGIRKFAVHTGTLPPGTYIVQVENGNGISPGKKLVKK